MLTTERQLETILVHAFDLARDVDGHLDVPVQGCPGWDVVALLEHLVEVHWFWAYDVENRLQERFDGDRPAAPPRDDLIEVFTAGAMHLIDVLRKADPGERVWTWAPSNRTVAFVSRHQVQEMVVHHADGVRAVGRDIVIAPDVGADCVDEFLTYSLSSAEDPKEPTPAPLGSAFALHATDSDEHWVIRDAATSGTLTVSRGPEDGLPIVAASGGDLLLWLYGRTTLATPTIDADYLTRFRALTYTD